MLGVLFTVHNIRRGEVSFKEIYTGRSSNILLSSYLAPLPPLFRQVGQASWTSERERRSGREIKGIASHTGSDRQRGEGMDEVTIKTQNPKCRLY
jgi:hypothetical protein